MSKYLVILLLVGCSNTEPSPVLRTHLPNNNTETVNEYVCGETIKTDTCEELNVKCKKFLDSVKCEAMKTSCIISEKKYQCSIKCSPLFNRCKYEVDVGDNYMCYEMLDACNKICMEKK